MFELQVALKYLIPRKKSLSTALISGLSVFVISLVIWLVLVFLSVLSGIEKNWLYKLTALHAPIRISPTDVYYNSYYYQIDSLSSSSNYTLKTLGEKAVAPLSDPYSEEFDREIPPFLGQPDPVDPVKTALQELSHLGLAHQDYEIGGALLRLQVNTPTHHSSYLSQMSYLLSISDRNPQFRSLLVPTDTPIDFEEEPIDPPPSHVYFVAGQLRLPSLKNETPILLPKNYKESGARLGSLGTLNYIAPSAASAQEQKIPVRVVGFYDPGILAIGNKCILVPTSITRAISTSNQTFSPDGTPTNGIFVWTQDLKETHAIAEKIRDRFAKAGLSPYWKIATFEEFEFSKDLLVQFQSDRMLFLLIASIILIVACSNIISLLVLLVNDKKREIAILQAMGASHRSIAAIFGFCGTCMGIVSCFFGVSAAIITLRHLDRLVALLSALQGRVAFNPAFFGHSLPNQLSWEAVSFVLVATPLLCLAAGLIPALKASRVRPSVTLRSE